VQQATWANVLEELTSDERDRVSTHFGTGDHNLHAILVAIIEEIKVKKKIVREQGWAFTVVTRYAMFKEKQTKFSAGQIVSIRLEILLSTQIGFMQDSHVHLFDCYSKLQSLIGSILLLCFLGSKESLPIPVVLGTILTCTWLCRSWKPTLLKQLSTKH
jgi:hypothetical protein